LESLYPDAGDAGVPMFVTLDRLYPADDQLVYSQAKAGGDRYIYRITQAGTQTIRLATTSADVGDCTVTLQADYFDTETVSVVQSNPITYSGKNITVTYNVNRPEVSGGSGSSNSYSAKINSITVDGAQVDFTGSATYTYSGNPGTLTITLDSISITASDLNDSTVVNFDCTVTRTRGNSSATAPAKFTKTIKDLKLTKSN
jgi:hypothetical protein